MPVFAVHGSADTLVPHRQAVDLCSAIEGTVYSSDIVDVETLYSCGTFSEVRVIRDAEHMLDLGFCVDPVCPAGAVGSQERAATSRAILAGFDWLARNAVLPPPPPPTPGPPPGSGGGGAMSLLVYLGLIYVLSGMAFRRRLVAKLRP